MITKQGDYRRIKLNSDCQLDFDTTQICLQFNSLDRKIILSILTKDYFTNLEVSEPCLKC